MTKKKLTEKQLELLIEEATVDCYDEGECRVGFLTMMQDNISTPFKAKLIGEIVDVVDIDGDDRRIQAIIKRQDKKYPVNILDLMIDEKEVKGTEWVNAYRRWELGQQ